ncbi:leukemia NUP98 fusion partner 1 [Anoplopoma fimbria]|uniref:leukemia NUP98 fusion partner 1 n=1 Tax=Anoplopoma fimbria TaxID=229290 RepID=UPI0023EDD265|nr:leukemia NUP98 fusion partner 1 [Anoplopoma fimbria]
MALRLLPAFTDNDDDDDGNFTNWMSSYWGHGTAGGQTRERKRSFRRPSGGQGDRRASLPTVSQLDAMKLNRLHAATMAPSPTHMKSREKTEVRSHQRARRASSDDNSRSRTGVPENRISTIPELTESFERRLYLRDKRTTSQNDDDMCLICHEEMKKNEGAVQELQCSHRFHKEAVRRSQQGRPPNAEAAADLGLSDERRKSADGRISMEKEELASRRQLSLRRHR